MAYLLKGKRISLLLMRGWDDQQKSSNEVRQLFSDTFRNENLISKSTVKQTIMSFEEIGNVKNYIISGWLLLVTVEEKTLDVAQSFVEDQKLSDRKA